MRRQELDNWVKSGGDLPDNLTEDEESYLEGLGWTVERRWHENGMKWSVFHWHQGKVHGKQKAWWDNGQKSYEQCYLHGDLHGKHETWFEDGQKACEFNYHYNKQHGAWKRWYQDGTPEEHEEYAYGVLLKDFLKQTS